MIPIQEGQITLKFRDETGAFKYDEDPFYQKSVRKLPETKGVDIVVPGAPNGYYLIELKDFRKHRIENKPRITNGELAEEVAQKFRDTIAALWGAWRTDNIIGNDTLFSNRNLRVEGILLLAEDVDRPESEKRLQRIRINLKTKLENLSKFLGIRVNIVTEEEFSRRYPHLLI